MQLELAEKFHWTLDYIDTLSMGQIIDLYETIDGRAKAVAFLQKKAKTK